MDNVAKLLWDPLLCVVYLSLGLLFLALTGAIAWRYSARIFLQVWRTPSAKNDGGLDHRAAFISALAASVGVGNLAGVATALHLGGPGALFWLWVSAAMGMSFRMCSTALAIKHRPRNSRARSYATPMAYLERFFPGGRIARLVAALLLLTGLVNANLIQSNSVADSLTMNFGLSRGAVAIGLAVPLTIVIFGGLRRIVHWSVLLAPWAIALYLAAGAFALLLDLPATIDTLHSVFFYARNPYSIAGGVAGYSVLTSLQFGVSRGIFSHGSGTGMAPFFQAANSDHPARGAFMAAVVPAIDSLVVCTVTGLVVLSYGYWRDFTGAHLTVSAFENALGGVGKGVVFICLVVFAFTTVASWAHYAERCFSYLGGKSVLAFRSVFAIIAALGPFLPVATVWSTADVLLGLLLLAHVLPLTYIVLKTSPALIADLTAARSPEFKPHRRRVTIY